MDNPLARLRQFIVARYDLEELRTLCFDLGVDYDELRGEGLSAKARELLLYLGRRGRFDALLDALRQPLPEPFDPAALQAATPSFEAGELQAEITELRQTMASMAKLGLPLAPAQGHLTALEARVSGLGAVAQDGSVAAGAGGVAVGGDVHGNIYVGLPPEGPTEALAIYRRVLAQTCGQLPLRGVDVGVSDPTAGRKPLGLTNVYVHLDTTAQVELTAAERKRRGHERPSLGERETRPLSALEAVIANRRLALLGDPGGGKTTFVNHLAHCLALSRLDQLAGWPRAEAEALPIRVILRDFARSLPTPLPECAEPSHLWHFVIERLEAQKLEFAADPICQALEQGQALVLLDGLDEVPTAAQRVFVRDAVNAFVKRYHPQNRVLVTCRVLSYQPPAVPSAPDLRLADFPTFELASLDEEKIDQFIDAWYDELGRTGVVRVEDTEGLARGLRVAVRRTDLWGLAPNPLLLTVMALVHTHKGRLPDARATLYEDTVDILLWRWEQIKAGGREQAPRLRQLLLEAGRTDLDLKRTLAQLAYEAHAQLGAPDDRDRLADIGELRLQKSLAALNGDDLNWARQVLETMKLRAGLLLERAPEVFTFPHRTFQEYLAGAHLAAQPRFAQQACKLAAEVGAWREVILLATGRLVYRLEDTDKPLALVGELCPSRAADDESGWHKAWLAGDVLLEVGANRVGDSALGRDLLARVRLRLAALLEGGRLSPRERTAAGNTLAQLGDPRPGVGLRLDGLPDILWCPVPGGDLQMGSAQENETANVDEYGPNGQPVSVPVDPFWVATYPVTVAQFRPFVQGDGYSDQTYWTPDGWECKERKGWTAPYFWNDPRWHLDNHPIVGVSWYEAVAYCRWLTHQLSPGENHETFFAAYQKPTVKSEFESLLETSRRTSFAIRLLTEAEREWVARGPEALRWPWGNDWVADACNSLETDIARTSAVGAFPGAAARWLAERGVFVHDLTGNVREWCSTRWQDKYPLPEVDEWNRDYLGGSAPRARRGGVFDRYRRHIRNAARRKSDPDSRFSFVGFRVAVSAHTPSENP